MAAQRLSYWRPWKRSGLGVVVSWLPAGSMMKVSFERQPIYKFLLDFTLSLKPSLPTVSGWTYRLPNYGNQNRLTVAWQLFLNFLSEPV
jgi:hypothetical protein